MTTIIPTHSIHIGYTATLLSPMHHGAGSSGNTSILRTQEVLQPDGATARVPFLSAASVRHALRDRLAWHLADTLGLDAGSLTKGQVDLLWTGGAVTETGAQTDLAMARRVEEHLPMLGLFGYAAHSDIVAGTLRATDMILVCQENAWRLPDSLAHTDPAGVRAANYRSEEFGTRHDVASTAVGRLVDIADNLLGGSIKTTQMIFDTQVLKAGSVLYGTLDIDAGGTDRQRRTLGAALALWAPDGQTMIGAKTASGYGRARLDGVSDHTADLDWWTRHIEQDADQIMALIQDLAS